MNQRGQITVCGLSLVLMLTSVPPGFAEEVEPKTASFTAQAYFTSENVESCVTLAILVDLASGATVGSLRADGSADILENKLPNGSTAANSLSIFISKSNMCTGELRTFYGGSSDVGFSWDADLGRAAVRASVPVYELGPNEIASSRLSTSVDLTWEAVADPVRIHDAEHYPFGDLMLTYVNDGLVRPASATGRIAEADGESIAYSAGAYTAFLTTHDQFVACASLKCHPAAIP